MGGGGVAARVGGTGRPVRADGAARAGRAAGAARPGRASGTGRPVRAAGATRPDRADRTHRATCRAARPSGFPHRIAFSLVIAFAAYGCEPALWSNNDHREIYASTLEALGEAVGADALVVDPAPTFLVEDETGVFRMGDRNRFGDPALSGAIEDLPETEPCRVEAPDEGCSAENRRFAVVSEALPGHGRDAALLAAHLDLDTGAVGHRFVRLRRGYGGWRVTSIEEGDEARPLR